MKPVDQQWRSDVAASHGDEAAASLFEYVRLLARDAIPHGLVGFPEARLAEEVMRSLLLLELLSSSDRFVDVGSGAGLPGVPLSVVRGRGCLVEPREKAARFLQQVIYSLGLAAELVAIPAEEASRGPRRESFDVSFARGLGPPSAALELSAPLVRPGGFVVLTASPESVPFESHGKGWASLGLGDAQVRRLEHRDIHQVIHIVQKVSPTAGEIPRRVGVARHKPLDL